DFGGQLLYVGDVGSQTLDIADPRDRARPAARLRVDAGSVATTCNSERARVVDGRRLGHVIDPRTGRPSSSLGSVTVWAESAFDADCLSTACFVLGPDEAIALAERTDGVEVLALSLDPLGHLVMSTSRGLKDHVSLLIDEPGKPRRAVADQNTQPK
ncbi:MAG: FAD:protein FMN transferase, partial [Planctomycetota bacterium]|nr:FAD:protein FMN transferase [Planctomycetota bacterium]